MPLELPAPDAAFSGHPRGRPLAGSQCCMLDLAKLGRSSKRFPIAPDGHIPNSVIRALYDPEPTKQEQLPNSTAKKAKPFRIRRRVPTCAAATASEAQPSETQDEQQFHDVTTRWETWADDEDDRATSSTSSQSDDEVEAVASLSPPPPRPPTPQENADVIFVETPSTTQEATTAEPQRRQAARRTINAGGQGRLPPLPSQQQLQMLRQQRRLVKPPPPQPQLPATTAEVDEIAAAKPPLPPPPPPTQPLKAPTPKAPETAQRRPQPPPAPAPPTLKRRQPATKKRPPPPPPPPQPEEPPTDDAAQEGVDDIDALGGPLLPLSESPSRDDQQADADDADQPTTEVPSILVERAPSNDADEDADADVDVDAVAVADADAERHAMKYFDEITEAEAESFSLHQEESSESELSDLVGADGLADESLLAQIIAEPWFHLAVVTQSKEPVAQALTWLMSESGHADDHGQMCQRLLDIKRHLRMETEFELRLVTEIVLQLEKLIANLLETAENMSDDLLLSNSLTRSKGDNLVNLLREFGHEIHDLSKRWAGAQLTSVLAEESHRDRRRLRGRRRRHHEPDSGVGTDSNASEELPNSLQIQPRAQPQPPLMALTEERLTTATLSRPDDIDDASLAGLDELLLDETETMATTNKSMTVRFALPPMGAAEDDGRLWLPPIQTPPRPHRQERPTKADIKELSIFDSMGDFRLKKLVQSLPKIEQMNLEAISERSRQTPYRCPRLIGHLPWIEQQTGFFSDRGNFPKPDVSNYAAAARGLDRGLRWPQWTQQGDDKDKNADTTFDALNTLDSRALGRQSVKEANRKAAVTFDVGGASDGKEQQRPLWLPPTATARLSTLWDGHCRMESLARHGMQSVGVPIGRFLTRDSLLDVGEEE